jgi:hypothetical protein
VAAGITVAGTTGDEWPGAGLGRYGERIIMMAESIMKNRGNRGVGTLALGLALLSLLSGCVVYVPYSAPPPHYHYWR